MKKNVKKIAAIVQARITSTRLPGKVLMDIEGKPMLWHTINRLKMAKKIDEIILAIPNTKKNDILVEFAEEDNLKYFRGSEEDVLSRYYLAAKKFNCDIIIRITSDCPLIDPKVVDLIIEKHLKSGSDYTSNVMKRTFPRGLDVEVFNFNVLEKVSQKAQSNPEKEHVTLYVRNHPKEFFLVNIENNQDISEMRWTVDEIADLEFIREIYKRLYKKNKIFLMKDIVDLLRKYPALMEINKNIRQKKV